MGWIINSLLIWIFFLSVYCEGTNNHGNPSVSRFYNRRWGELPSKEGVYLPLLGLNKRYMGNGRISSLIYSSSKESRSIEGQWNFSFDSSFSKDGGQILYYIQSISTLDDQFVILIMFTKGSQSSLWSFEAWIYTPNNFYQYILLSGISGDFSYDTKLSYSSSGAQINLSGQGVGVKSWNIQTVGFPSLPFTRIGLEAYNTAKCSDFPQLIIKSILVDDSIVPMSIEEAGDQCNNVNYLQGQATFGIL